MNLSEAQFERLLKTLGEPRSMSTLAQCSARYGGSRKSTDVETFLAAVNVYKKLEHIQDEDALTGLPLLLTDDAATWWQGVKTQVRTWVDFETRLRHTFAPKKLPYIIYQEIVRVSQVHQSTASFIAEKRALIAQLPESHKLVEDQLIDLVYGQLRLDIREKIAREHVTTFDDLLEKTREVESHMLEKANLTQRPLEDPPIKPKRCNFCRIPGHTAETCRKKAKAEQSDAVKPSPTTDIKPEKPRLSCYGCGEPGVVRSRCTKCSSQRRTSSNDASFCGVKIGEMNPRPVVRIQIGHIKGTAQIDTGARSNVASYSLYQQLRKNGYIFEEKEMSITLADGIPKRQTALTVRAPIAIFGRVIPSSFVVLPQATNNLTLLGVGFIVDAMLILNIPQRTCRFMDDPSTAYDLEEESIQEIVLEKLKEEFALPRIISPMATTPKSGQSPQPSKVIPEVASGLTVVPVSGMNAEEDVQPREAVVPSEDIPEVHETANIANMHTPPRSYGPLIPVDLSTPPNKKPKLMFDGHSPVIDALYYDAQTSLAEYDEVTDLSPELTLLFEPKNHSPSTDASCEKEQ
ncbi:uncharacterized protein LOC114363967 [Ostrinia furnacalis]|uniref:uncharacterized protein LOC114363967 n=1 Tax=Ostrinia furnacalis TaxID=93504 RepID=UPI00103B19DD|nr:uncharacterized protein LOC114363967 [Ostrinia furnacalis]